MRFSKIFIWVVLSLALMSSSVVLGNSKKDHKIEKNKLTVYGKVKVITKGDIAKIRFSLKEYGKSLQEAFEKANNEMNIISGKLFEIGLEEKELSTSFFNSSENFGDRAFWSSKKDYSAEMDVLITTTKMDLLEKIVSALSESKIEKIESVAFELQDYEQLKKDAFTSAIRKAKDKADLISEMLGIEYKGVTEFTEIKTIGPISLASPMPSPQTPFNAIVLNRADFEQGSGLFAQEFSFESEVKIVYEIKEFDDNNNNEAEG